ncbi:MAG: methylated-DNA--[protein]-cysteine S-methyltransferase [Candidatus Geothermarchaeales archaeon]
MLKPTRLVIADRDGRFVGVAYGAGVLANTVPHPTRSDVIRDLQASKVDAVGVVGARDPVADVIFDLWAGREVQSKASEMELDFSGLTEKTRKVLKAVRKIPAGQTLSYSEVASQVGFNRATRFVGNVMAANRFPLVVPCHRVVKADGSVGGYAYGSETKAEVLRREGCQNVKV